MKTPFLATLLTTVLLFPGLGAAAESKSTSPAKTPPKAQPPKSELIVELDRLVASINAKVKEGKRAAADYGDELKQFDAMEAKHKGGSTEDLSRVAYMRATLYTQIFKDEAKGTELLEKLAKDYPDTRYGKSAESRLKSLAAQAHLAVGKKFPDFTEADLDGKPLSIAGYKGKVLLVDFWATWCGPCIGELPNVKQAYQKFHKDGFDIVGISLDSDLSKLTDFIAKHEMPWRQFFDGQGWKNKVSQQYGINSIPATFLLDGDGKVIARDLRGPQLEAAVAKALGKAN